MTATPIHPITQLELADEHITTKINQLVVAVNTLNSVSTPSTPDA